MKTLYPLECHFAEILTLTDTATTRFLPCLQRLRLEGPTLKALWEAGTEAAILLVSTINGTQCMQTEVMTYIFSKICQKNKRK